MEAEAAQARVAVAQAESMYKSERAQWVTSLDAQKFEVGVTLEQWWKRAVVSGPCTAALRKPQCTCDEQTALRPRDLIGRTITACALPV
jgi:hypothetical protein